MIRAQKMKNYIFIARIRNSNLKKTLKILKMSNAGGQKNVSSRN